MASLHDSEDPAAKRICGSILETIGNTPLVRLSRLTETVGIDAEILAKLEFFNPLGSIKDRIGLAMIEALEREGRITDKTVLVEPTSGNTGIALAFVAAAKGYRLVLTMPESMSMERRRMLLFLGAELELTPAERGMRGAIDRAEELVKELPDAIMPQQFDNPANPEIHRQTTAEEIWRDTGGRIDAFVTSVGTGGTLTGCGALLKARNPEIQIVAVEPEDSQILSGGRPGQHLIEGIGAGFIPSILDTGLIDEVIPIANETAFRLARQTAAVEGLPVGISGGAALAAAVELCERPKMSGRRVLVIIPSFAERYLSTPLFDKL